MTERDPIDNAALEILEEFNALIQEYDNRDVVRAVTGILATTVYAASNSPTKPASWSTLSQLMPDYRRHARGREGQQTGASSACRLNVHTYRPILRAWRRHAAVYIHLPILVARLAVQITVKAGWRNGLQAEPRGGRAEGPFALAAGLRSSLNKRSGRVGCMKHI
jgi:hypothetical protein